MTTPSVLVPKTELEKLETAIADRKCFRAADGFYDPVFDAARAYLASQRMIATAKEDISDTSKPDDRTQPDLSSSDRTLIASKEETPQSEALKYYNVIWDTLNSYQKAMNEKQNAIIRAALSQSSKETPQDVQRALLILDDYFDKQDDDEFFLEIDKDDAKAVRAALVYQSKDGWQDITTAPKDGDILIWNAKEPQPKVKLIPAWSVQTYLGCTDGNRSGEYWRYPPAAPVEGE